MNSSHMSRRWRLAQAREDKYNRRIAESIPAQSEEKIQAEKGWALGLIKEYTGVPVEQLSQLRMLEIGGGITAVGLLGIQTPLKISLDPLIASAFFEPDRYHVASDGALQNVQAVAEHTPLSDNSVDLCWISNVIDHTSSPPAVIREIRRVLTDDGMLIISCNTFPEWSRPFFPIFDRLDGPHPHHFTERTFKALVETEFNIVTKFLRPLSTPSLEFRSWKDTLGAAFAVKKACFRCTPRRRQLQFGKPLLA
jgi:SAM-dependent methyltransferase